MTEPNAPSATRVVLADGSEAMVRHVAAADRPAVERLFATARPTDLYTRFFSVGTAVVDLHVEHLFSSGATATSYVVERAGSLLGIADVEPVGEHSAEVAFLVADGAHGLGIATLLLERAAQDAWDRGITTFVADVLAVNHPMIEVFRDAGFEVGLHIERDGVSVRMSTCRTPEVQAATAARHASAVAHQGSKGS
ncbi:MAG: hypothetical protein JWQ91_511 [Aeromicrobium sp.]|jgi:GNAT superfamily N-acetyltransferase|uniref:GNAT family N-acetyltransferase n=1 Tax=Aeromicrobium sp. TaxID=1871063 RepID=UPI002602EBD2|nr:GNAT family N-acetyltransferase [Aeromicrobium sp.]MCW2787924.1 hypothetical protein [Aeromicrobium sp.]MCW2823594.1 hypothetical protein [Aeromicrobium sp.]